MTTAAMSRHDASFPRVLTLCGSTRFKDDFLKANFDLTLAGNVVLSVSWFGHADGPIYTPTPAEKVHLDMIHLRKIDLSDAIYVLNVGGYVGASTRNEVAYAFATGKGVIWHEPKYAMSIEQVGRFVHPHALESAPAPGEEKMPASVL